MTDTLKMILLERLFAVRERIRSACDRAGRPPEDVTLVAVTKTVTANVARIIADLGLGHLGESRPQELWRKAEALGRDRAPCWHLVGHLQRNKVERTLPLVHLIHSVDSTRLLSAIDEEAARQGRTADVLLEVNAAGEASKHGFALDELAALMPRLAELHNVRVHGLMTMAAYEEDPERCRPTFALLRRLRDRLRPAVGPAHPFDQLSMGMSNDFEVAVEEGATLVRLGTVLFEGLPRDEV
jgi:pyridoxal phosphate enzyme (YggS family)